MLNQVALVSLCLHCQGKWPCRLSWRARNSDELPFNATPAGMMLFTTLSCCWQAQKEKVAAIEAGECAVAHVVLIVESSWEDRSRSKARMRLEPSILAADGCCDCSLVFVFLGVLREQMFMWTDLAGHTPRRTP